MTGLPANVDETMKLAFGETVDGLSRHFLHTATASWEARIERVILPL